MPAFLKWFLVVLAVFVLFSCSSSHSPADSDIIPDSDSDDIETVADDTDSDEDSDFIEDSDETQDADADADSDSDIPEKVECLDLRYNENTIKLRFRSKMPTGNLLSAAPVATLRQKTIRNVSATSGNGTTGKIIKTI